MDKRQTIQEAELRFFATAPRPCSYLEGRTAISVFADPNARLSMPLYNQLARYGFRRSGNELYVPACPGCSGCVPVRIPVQAFERNRGQRRTWKRNSDIEWQIMTPGYDTELFTLYRIYLSSRHQGGGMDNPDESDFTQFLTSYWCDSLFLVGRLERRPVVVAVTDQMDRALSAVYTFFDPSLARRSLGTLAILRQIELARDIGSDWLYLGYWIRGSHKMHYKGQFTPLQGYRQGKWQPLDPGANTEVE
jgi:arginine-tRNA-protein transferase